MSKPPTISPRAGTHVPEVRVATFNVENLLARFDFRGNASSGDRVLRLYDIEGAAEFEDAERARTISLTDDTRQHSALAIADTDADIVCLQEVENLATLEAFEHGYLHRMLGAGYPNRVWMEGNDSRGIDVALLARERTAAGDPIEIVRTKSHRRLTYGEAGLFDDPIPKRIEHPNERVFRRDLLEVHLRIGGRPLTLYVAHLKAMGGSREAENGDVIEGREWSMPVRTAEARAIRAIIEANHRAAHRWMICGDLNDYMERIVVSGLRGAPTFERVTDPSEAISVLLNDGFAYNPVSDLPDEERWTLYFVRTLAERHLCQLDYLLLSPALHETNADATPDIVRAGQPFRTPFPPSIAAERYPRVGWDRPKASDHCPVAITLRLK